MEGATNVSYEDAHRRYLAEVWQRAEDETAPMRHLAHRLATLTRERDDATNLLQEVARITCAEHWYDDELEDGTEDCSVCQLLARVRAFVTKEYRRER
jgi:hypothetical protein